MSCVEWGASIGLSDLRGHPGGIHSPSNIVPPATEGLAFLDGGCDSQGRPVVVIRMCRINKFLLETSGRRALLRCVSIPREASKPRRKQVASVCAGGVVLLCLSGNDRSMGGWGQGEATSPPPSCALQCNAVPLNGVLTVMGQR